VRWEAASRRVMWLVAQGEARTKSSRRREEMGVVHCRGGERRGGTGPVRLSAEGSMRSERAAAVKDLVVLPQKKSVSGVTGLESARLA